MLPKKKHALRFWIKITSFT